jgi:hypothetical protein
MPIDKSRVDRMIKMMDEFLIQHFKDSLSDDDEDEDEFLDPLDAPPSEPFYSDSPPEQIHGQPKKDLFK